MTERVRMSESAGPAPVSTVELIDRLSRFDGPPEAFLVNLLAVQCYIAAANGGAMLRLTAQGQVEVLAVYPQIPEGKTPPVWLAKAVEVSPQVLQAGQTLLRPLRTDDELYGAPPRTHLVLVPIRGSGSVRGAAAFLIESSDPDTLNVCRERIELTVSLLSLYEMRLTLQRRQADLARLRMSMEILSAVNDHDKFQGAGMSLVNELASRFVCDRVGLGFLKNRYVHLKALSHTEKFSRKMKVVQDIESSMEECLDQDVETVFPAATDATFVNRASKELSTHHGPSAVLNLPIRRAGEPKGVLTLERPAEKPFTLDEVESLRLTCDLASARLVGLFDTDKWIGARFAGGIRKGAAAVVGPKHTWIKLVVIGLVAFVLATSLIRGPYRAEAPFTMEAVTQRMICTPFDGIIAETFVEPGDWVTKGTVLAKMETRKLDQALNDAEVKYSESISKKDSALSAALTAKTQAERDAKQAEANESAANARAAEREVAWLKLELDDAQIKAPYDGYILEGDLKKQTRPPKNKGDVLFSMAESKSKGAPIALQAVLEVSEEDIPEVRKLQDGYGQLATTGYPDKRMNFTIARITPVAEVVEQKNIYKVRVDINNDDVAKYGAAQWISPGIKGQARVYLTQKPYLQMWTQKAINWVRMKLWI